MITKLKFRIWKRRAESPMEHRAQGKRSDTLGTRVGAVAPCKGKSFNPLCCYSYLITDFAVLKWNIVCIFCSTPAPCLKAFALTGRDCSNTRYPGCRFACPGLGAFGLLGRSRPNPKLELLKTKLPKSFVLLTTSVNNMTSRHSI